MTVHQLKNNILNNILKHLESKPQPIVLTDYLKSIGIEDPSLVKFYEAKLNQDGHINLKPLSLDRKHAMITERGRVFINEGGYKTTVEKTTSITSEKLKNQILKEIHDENEGRIVADIADNFGMTLTAEQIKAIEVELYQDGLITTTKLPHGTKVLHLTEKGHDFISDGGYKSATQKSIEYTVKSSFEKSSKDHFERKKPHEIKTIHHKIQSVFDNLIHKIGVVSNDELILITAPLSALYEELYGKVSNENSKCLSIIRDMKTCREEVLPFLKNSLTRLELKIPIADLNVHPKIKPVSEQLFIDGHYKQAVLEAFILLDNTVQSLIGSSKTGKPLMEEAFSANKPKIRFTSDQNEQLGMMYLYSGSIAGIRNRYSHKTIKLTDKNYALDLLHFASALMRLLDDQSIY